jgi:hypothetical protein
MYASKVRCSIYKFINIYFEKPLEIKEVGLPLLMHLALICLADNLKDFPSPACTR